MNKYLIEIQLLSDLCVSDGGVYNSSIDIDICYDNQGFPYIPAKRLKGCLRECAQELNAWELIKKNKVKEIFGDEGNKAGNMKLGNAYLDEIENFKDILKKYEGNNLLHPQNVLNHFTYCRTQTAMDYDSGVAENNSLRVTRVVKKGLVFLAQLTIDEYYRKDIEKCCTALNHMGISRTRGLGEIKVKLIKDKIENRKEQENIIWKDKSTYLEYELELEEAIICKSINGQDAQTMDYIDGVKILGIIAQRINEKNKNAFLELMKRGELNCSNAYICEDGYRFIEAPATLYSIKNNKSDYVDKIYETKESEGEYREKNLQLNSMKHCYVNYGINDKLKIKNVEIEERYHHRRPNDKGIGHVIDEDDSKFYQLSSIRKGQTFKGFITGNEEQIKIVYECLNRDHEVRIGQGKRTEYGKVNLRITKVGNLIGKVKKEKEFFALLQSPAIIYNDKATYSTDIKDLKEEIIQQLEIDKNNLEEVENISYHFVKYVTVGGFNITWGYHKPMVEAFDKGTVIKFTCKETVRIDTDKIYWIGERCNEGYGEMKIFSLVENRNNKNKLDKIQNKASDVSVKLNIAEEDFLKELVLERFMDFIKAEAAEHASHFIKEKDLMINSYTKPTVSNMLLMYKESKENQKGFEEIKNRITERYGEKTSDKKQAKRKVADDIVGLIESEIKEIIKEFVENYNVEDFEELLNNENIDIKLEFLGEFLIQMKYALRKGDKNESCN